MGCTIHAAGWRSSPGILQSGVELAASFRARRNAAITWAGLVTAAEMLLHASCIALAEAGVLLMAPPGGGKSDLALRLLGRGAALVADDQVMLAVADGALHAGPPAALAGRMEVRGLGLLEGLPWRAARLVLAVELVGREAVPRLPEPAGFEALGCRLPLLRLDGRAASAPDVIAWALAALEGRCGMTAGAFAA
jgi:HPr kinase/phosphorylase